MGSGDRTEVFMLGRQSLYMSHLSLSNILEQVVGTARVPPEDTKRQILCSHQKAVLFGLGCKP